jgi:hypothetical protein
MRAHSLSFRTGQRFVRTLLFNNLRNLSFFYRPAFAGAAAGREDAKARKFLEAGVNNATVVRLLEIDLNRLAEKIKVARPCSRRLATTCIRTLSLHFLWVSGPLCDIFPVVS